MRVKVLVKSRLSVFSDKPRIRSKVYEVGDEVELPDWYAQGLVETGLVSDLDAENLPPMPVLTEGAMLWVKKNKFDKEKLRGMVGSGARGKVTLKDLKAL